MAEPGAVGLTQPSHARRSLIILGVGALIFIVLTATQPPGDRGPMAVFFAAIILAPTLLVVLLLARGDRDSAQRARFRAAAVIGQVYAATGYNILLGSRVLLAARGDAVSLDFDDQSQLRIPLDEVLALAFGGPGTQIQSVSVVGSGVDFGPMALGSASANVKTVTNTFVHVTSTTGAFTVYTDEADPSGLEAIFADALLALRHRRDVALATHTSPPAAAGAGRLKQLERLAALRASGALSDVEYAHEKARVLGA